jgi:hypothetical protein
LQVDSARRGVRHLAQQRGQVGLAAKQAAYGRGVAGAISEAGSGYLVQQRLDQVVVGFVHQGRPRGGAQGPGGFQADKAAADDTMRGGLAGPVVDRRSHGRIMRQF